MTDLSEVAAALPMYEVVDELGRGAYGVVWSGVHRQLRRRVAIKQLSRSFSTSPEVRARFEREARVLASLDFPHVVNVYDYVEHEHLCLLVMEELGGGTVEERFAPSTRPSLEDAAAVVLAACAGLHHAHQQRVLHRDVKPANLLLSETGVLKVTDFGIAKVVGGGRSLATATGTMLGTPAYMAPEQITGAELTAACDVYALAVVLYEMLSGTLPQSEEGALAVILHRRAYEPAVPMREVAPHVPVEIEQVVMAGLATDPSARPPTAEQFALAVAEAVARTAGAGWLDRASTVVHASTAVLDAARHEGPSRRPPRPRDTLRSLGDRPRLAPTPLPPTTSAGLPDVLFPLPDLLARFVRPATCSPVPGGVVVAGGGPPTFLLLAPGTAVHAVADGRLTAVEGSPSQLVLETRGSIRWTYTGLRLGPAATGSEVSAGDVVGVVPEGPESGERTTGFGLGAVDAAGVPLDVVPLVAGLPEPGELLTASAPGSLDPAEADLALPSRIASRATGAPLTLAD